MVEASTLAKNLQILATRFKFTQEYVQSPALDSLNDIILKMWQQLTDNRLNLVYQLKE